MKAKSPLLKRGLTLAAAAALVAVTIHPAPCEGQAESPLPTQASTAARNAHNPKRVSFYQVPLVCPAAPHIGCGTAAKPFLLELESSPVVSEAWLHRAGTIIAVVWSEQSTARQHAGILKNVLKDRELTAKELKGVARDQALKDFQSTSGWYRGADVDRPWPGDGPAAVVGNAAPC